MPEKQFGIGNSEEFQLEKALRSETEGLIDLAPGRINLESHILVKLYNIGDI